MSNAFEQSLFVFFREDLHKLLKVSRPIVENISGSLASCVEEVTIDQVFQDALVRLTEVPGAVVAGSCLVFVRQDGAEFNALRIAALRKRSVFVIDISNTARHTGAEVSSDVTQNHHSASGHVFAAVIAAAFRNRCCAGKTNGKTLTGYAVKEGFTARSSVQNRVAGDDVFVASASEVGRAANNNASAGETLTDIIVGFTDQIQRHTVGQEGSEGLSGNAGQLNVQCVFGQTFGTPATNNFRRNLRTDRAVNVFDRRDKADFFSVPEVL